MIVSGRRALSYLASRLYRARFAVAQGHGYRLKDRHHTFIGKRKIAKGADPMSVAHNAVYARAV